MRVLIRGMEMPTTCGKCTIKNAIECDRWKLVRSVALDRHKGCPLVPIPPHGRLIDADAVAKMVLGSVNQEDAQGFMFTKIICQILKDAPTIIPAEEGET